MMPRTVVPLLLGLVLAGCQPLPHPFEDAQLPPDAPILQLPDTVGILVEPVAGAPAGGALAEAVATALQDREVPADAHASNERSYHLQGDAGSTQVTGATAAVAIQWTLYDARGTKVAGDLQRMAMPATAWANGPAAALAPLAVAEAPRLAAMVQEPPPVEHDVGRQVYIRPAEGAPGDGRTALPRSLTFLLTRAGIAVTPDSQTLDAVIVGPTVDVGTSGSGRQHVRIVWHIYRPDGTEAGQVSQENDVQNGTLDGTWGDVSMAVATAGIDQIVNVINHIPLKNPIRK